MNWTACAWISSFSLISTGVRAAEPLLPQCEAPKVLRWGECVYEYPTPPQPDAPARKPDLAPPERGCRDNLGALPADLRFVFGAYEARYANAIWVSRAEPVLLTVERARAEIVRALKQDRDILRVEIQGHTSSLERPEQTKLQLSKARAEAVKKLLLEKPGIAPERLSIAWFGDSCIGGARDEVRLVITERRAMADRDGDGVADKYDKCPNVPEDHDGFEDRDGCPEPDNDRDGVPDERDQCPFVAEDKDGDHDDDGCPEEPGDQDGDQIPDALDKCPEAAEDLDGFQDEDGCPEPDNDGDGIMDALDRCPEVAEDIDGCKDDDGCPDDADACEGEDIVAPTKVIGPQNRPDFFESSSGVAAESAQYLTGTLSVPVWRYPFKVRGGLGLGDDLELALELRPTFSGVNEIELFLAWSIMRASDWGLGAELGIGGGLGANSVWSVVGDVALKLSYFVDAWAFTFHVMPQLYKEDGNAAITSDVSLRGLRFFLGVTAEVELVKNTNLVMGLELDVAPSHRYVHEISYLNDPSARLYPSLGLMHLF